MELAHGNSVVLLRPLASVLGRLGVDGDRFLAGVGVGRDTPSDAYVPNSIVDRSLEAIAAARGDESFGLTIAREAVARAPLGLFGNLVWLSGTLRDALAQGARFYSLVTRRSTLSLDVGEGGRVATLTQRLRAGARRGDILTEYLFASLVLRARFAAGRAFEIRGMRFAHTARGMGPYEDLFRGDVTFDRGHGEAGIVDALTLDASMLDLQLSSADPLTAAAIEAEASQRLRRAVSVPLAESVRSAVRSELGRPSLSAVARRLGVGGRALRRQLEAEHLSLRGIVASAQRARASELLAEGASVKEVAFELGFSEPSAFSRAYKRWTGRAPSR
jgi:AraC-like DNA-binding protein